MTMKRQSWCRCIDVLLIAWAVVILAGHITTQKSVVIVETTTATTTSSYEDHRQQPLSLRGQLGEEFQAVLEENQFPSDCKTRRLLLVDGDDVELLSSSSLVQHIQIMARYLMVGLATDRTVVLLNSNSICVYNDGNNTRNCWLQPVTNCTSENSGIDDETKNSIVEGRRQSNQGIIFDPETKKSLINNTKELFYFVPHAYGNNRLFRASDPININNASLTYTFTADDDEAWFTHADHVEHWERSMGRFWIRSQLADFIWKGVVYEDDALLPSSPYMALDMRFFEYVEEFYQDFGRDAAQTRDVEQFMELVQGIRDRTGIVNIYLATDYAGLASHMAKNYPEYTFHQSPEPSHRPWWKIGRRRSNDVARELYILQRADYLVGTFQSNFYRLATELNSAYNDAHKENHQRKRHYSVDIEWFEKP